MMRVLITTVPFGGADPLPLRLLEEAGAEYLINPLNRRLTEDELAEMIAGYDIVIAGTEPITEKVLHRADRLKLISRVGIGLDSVDLMTAKRNGVQVSYTPDAPAPAVAELAMGLMLSLLRGIHTINARMHAGEWLRHAGRRLSTCTVGILGVGRIGSRVVEHVQGFHPARIMLNDLSSNPLVPGAENVSWNTKEEIYRDADIITLHLPLTAQTRNLITRDQLLSMKRNALIINTARGGIVNEADLARVLAEGHLGGAAVDVFVHEPYAGELTTAERCLLTSHMGSMSVDCRAQMEIEATEEAIRYIKGEPLQGLVPAQEYELQLQQSYASR